MRFKAYILGEGRSQGMDLDGVVKLTMKNALKNFKSIYATGKVIPIYRGTGISTDYGIVDTNQGRDRMSRNTDNYTTLLFDNLPSWKAYPKRSKGLICSTDADNSESYGNLYQVIPYDNTKIGVCPEPDIWDSFQGIAGSMYFSLSDFNGELYSLFTQHKIDVDQTSYGSLVKGLVELNQKSEFRNHKFWERLGIFNPNRNIIKHLNTILSPSKNGFKMGINNIKPDREVWIQGTSILVAAWGDIVDRFVTKVLDGM